MIKTKPHPIAAASADAQAAAETIAQQIDAISAGIKSLRGGRLTDRALFLLIQDAAPTVKGKSLTIQQIKAVLDGLEHLRMLYTCGPRVVMRAASA
jgi:hypothetical protein